ncbi:uncharacterized protein G2W53_019558 [Senna tora]|uniref:Uncharacterized protein n=1 Tax=Senna tora TaxID=362788 RepID=A0A834WS11_9FABA|nr:uncharacterized protein G2W53_019558 [Senna tora]
MHRLFSRNEHILEAESQLPYATMARLIHSHGIYLVFRHFELFSNIKKWNVASQTSKVRTFHLIPTNSFDLNSMHTCVDSLMEGLKTTMLHQETMFRMQVQELHRLYRIQKMLMENIDLKQFDRYTYTHRKACTQSTRFFHSSDTAGHESSVSLLEDTKFSSTAKVGSPHSKSLEFPDKTSSCYNINRKPLDFRFPSDQLTSDFGLEKCHKALVDKSTLKNKQCCEAGTLDLNQVQLDDSSCYTSDHTVASHSEANSSLIFGIHLDLTLEVTYPSTTKRKKSSECSCDVSGAIDSVLINSSSKSDLIDPIRDESKGSEAGLTSMNDIDNRNVGSIWELSDDQSTNPDSTNLETRKVKHDKCRDNEISCDFQIPPQVKDGDGKIVPALCDSSSIDDKSSSIKTRQPQSNLGITNQITTDQHLGADGENQLVDDWPKEVEAPEMAMCTQEAAQLLMNFSWGNSSKGYIEVEKKMEKPQCSDSYELIALKLEQCNEDDSCVSSKPYEIEVIGEKKDFSFKIKRGRRFKDFQREILPGLASLSGDEIQEDIDILEAVLRSREYCKIKSTMGDQSSWCKPMRSRRSKRSNVRRRIF